LAVSSQCRSLKAVQGYLKENVGHFEVRWGDLFTFLGVTSESAQSTEMTDFYLAPPLDFDWLFLPLKIVEGHLEENVGHLEEEEHFICLHFLMHLQMIQICP
jgi:hypothetical protein